LLDGTFSKLTRDFSGIPDHMYRVNDSDIDNP